MNWLEKRKAYDAAGKEIMAPVVDYLQKEYPHSSFTVRAGKVSDPPGWETGILSEHSITVKARHHWYERGIFAKNTLQASVVKGVGIGDTHVVIDSIDTRLPASVQAEVRKRAYHALDAKKSLLINCEYDL